MIYCHNIVDVYKRQTFNTADIILDDGDFIADTITVNGGTISLSYGDCDFRCV